MQDDTQPDVQIEVLENTPEAPLQAAERESQTPPKSFVEAMSVPLAIVIAGGLVAAGIYFSGTNPTGKAGANVGSQVPGIGQDGTQPSGPVAVSADDDAILGNANAPVTIIEFSDFQCPFCRRSFSDVLPKLKSQYIDTGKVKFVYRDFPLPFHESAQPAAEAAECAGDQGKFWEMHDLIFSEQEKQGQGTIQFTVDDIKKWAASAGLNTGEFNNCLSSGKQKSEVEKDYQDGQAAGVSGTPTFFINGKILVGAQPFSAFEKLIEEELAGK